MKSANAEDFSQFEELEKDFMQLRMGEHFEAPGAGYVGGSDGGVHAPSGKSPVKYDDGCNTIQ